MLGQMDGRKVHTLKVTQHNHRSQGEAEVSVEPLTEQVRRFTAQVTALLADIEIELEATIARELSSMGSDSRDEADYLERLRPRRFLRAA